MKEKFDEILKRHGIYGEDVEEILYSVSEMLELVVDETKEKEPYATNSINRLEVAAREVWNLSIDL